MTVWTKRPDESEYEFIYRLGSNKEAIGTWQTVADICNDQLGYEYTESRYRKMYQAFSKMFDGNKEHLIPEDAQAVALRSQETDLKIERKKIQAEKVELNDYLRAIGRHELMSEKIADAISRLEPFKPLYAVDNETHSPEPTTGLLCVSDFHAGSEFEICGISGEIINKYNFEIMQERLWKLSDMIDEDDVTMCDDLVVAILGDAFENVLRMSSLTKLREPVLDTVIKTSEFVSTWLQDLQERTGVPITVVTVGGNHDVQRVLGSKPEFEDENLCKLMVEFMKLRLARNQMITVDDYTDTAVKGIRGNAIMFNHGIDKNLQATMSYFEMLYGVCCDEIICGHLHRPESRTTGMTTLGDKVVTRVGSICGTDTFAKKIRVAAKPSAYFALYTEAGKTWERKFLLD